MISRADTYHGNILLADDEVSILETTKAILERDGHRVLTVETSDEVMRAIEEDGFDMIIVDYKMPGNENLELVKLLGERYSECPIIIFTGYPSLPSAVRSHHLNVFDYLPKPVDINYLRARVAEGVSRYRLNRAVAVSERRYRGLIESMSDAVFLFGLDGRVTFTNRQSESLTGYSAVRLRGMRYQDLIVLEDREAVAPQMALALAEEQPRLMQFGLRRFDGRVLYVEASVSKLPARESTPSEFQAVVRDISSRVSPEHGPERQYLVKAATMELASTLAGGVAHDFNNLMSIVLGNVDVVRQELGTNHPLAPMLSDIEDAATQASHRAEQLLAFARGGKYESRRLDLNGVVKSTVSSHVDTYPSRVGFELDLATGLWAVMADETQMAQVLTSLCLNAVEAIEGSGTVTVSTVNCAFDEAAAEQKPGLAPGRYAGVSVQDTGEGIPRTIQPRVFEPFFTTKFLGRGLGLAAVYGIVKNHGGYVEAQSEEGRGTTLTFYIPALE